MGSGTAAEYSSRVRPGYSRKPSGAAGVPAQTLADRSAGRWHGGGQGFESPQLHREIAGHRLFTRIEWRAQLLNVGKMWADAAVRGRCRADAAGRRTSPRGWTST